MAYVLGGDNSHKYIHYWTVKLYMRLGTMLTSFIKLHIITHKQQP